MRLREKGEPKRPMSKHLIMSIVYLLLLAGGWLMSGAIMVGPFIWQINGLISLLGMALIIFSIVKLVYHFPKINSNK